MAWSFGGQLLSELHTISTTAGSGPTIAVNWNSGNVQTVTLGHAGTATVTLANGIMGGLYTLVLVQDGDGNHAVDYAITGVKWVGGTPPTQTLTAGKKDILYFIYDGEYLGADYLNF